MSFKDKKNWTNLRELVCFSSNSDNQISKMKISFEKLVLIDEQDVENFYYRFSQIPFENFKEGNEKYKQIYELEDNEIYSYRLIDDDNLEDERLIELLDDLFEYSYALSFEDLLEEEREKNPLHEIFSDAEWDVFELKEKHELDYTSIAQIRDATESTIRDQFRNAKKKLNKFEKICDRFTEWKDEWEIH